MEDATADVLILISTYKRPKLLKGLLDSLAHASRDIPCRVVVVDNDVDESASEVCRAASLEIDYVVERKPGIAAARNAGLAMRGEEEYVIFVDDDEWVESDWLSTLLACARQYHADVVSGPVISVFPPDVPRWIVDGGFIQRPRFATGQEVRSPATNNTLVRAEILQSLEHPWFSEDFSVSGGSDTEFFYRLRQSCSPRMIWCNEAVVSEVVPVDRANLQWVWKRGIRVGNVTGRLHLRDSARERLLVRGVVRIAYGSVRTLASVCSGRGVRAVDVQYLTRGIGWVQACVGIRSDEYSRKRP